MLIDINLNTLQQMRVRLRCIKTVVCCHGPIVTSLLNSFNHTLTDVLTLPDRVGKAAHWMTKLLL